jgi:hypothetical protein
VEEGRAILVVCHDHDGYWQFLDGAVVTEANIEIVCMGCIYERDGSIAALADMPAGWLASRVAVESPWTRDRYDDEESHQVS